jgi:hypothetical protein
MPYFKRFPVVRGYEIVGRTLDSMDITRRTGFLQSVTSNEALYIDHEIEDGESPIVLADRIYNDSDLYWIIMLFNNVYDISEDWPLDYSSLETYIARIYDDRNGVHHYESIASGAIVDSDWPEYDKLTVTNFEYEVDENDKKRKIKVPAPEAVSQLIREHNRLISQ